MLFKNRRRAIIFLTSLLILLLYITRSFSIVIPFSLTIIALLLFNYIDKSFKFNFPEIFYYYVFIIFLFGAILGPGNPPLGFYYKQTFYDKILHSIGPFMMSSILFFILNRLNITLKWKLLMTVGLVFGILGLFEIGEYLSDAWFGTLNQGVYLYDVVAQVKFKLVTDPLTDTMRDLIFGLIGSGAYVGYKTLRVYLSYKKI